MDLCSLKWDFFCLRTRFDKRYGFGEVVVAGKAVFGEFVANLATMQEHEFTSPASFYPDRRHEAAAPGPTVAGNLIINMARPETKRAVIAITCPGAAARGFDSSTAVLTNKAFIFGKEMLHTKTQISKIKNQK